MIPKDLTPSEKATIELDIMRSDVTRLRAAAIQVRRASGQLERVRNDNFREPFSQFVSELAEKMEQAAEVHVEQVKEKQTALTRNIADYQTEYKEIDAPFEQPEEESDEGAGG